MDRDRTILVEGDLSVRQRPEILIAGDLIAKEQNGKPLPGVAQLAIQSGTHAALNIRADLAQQPRTPFRYVDKGAMATIGRNMAVAQIGRMQFSGAIAWLMWLLVHILFLVEFRNRIGVLFEWAWAYLTWQRGSRVIVDVPADTGEPLLAANFRPENPVAPALDGGLGYSRWGRGRVPELR